MAVFDPTAREVAEVKLLGKVYEVAEFGARRIKRINRLQKQLQKLSAEADEADEDGSGADDVIVDDTDLKAVELMCEMVEVSMVGGEGLGAKLWEAFNLDDEKLAEDDPRRGVSMPYLVRLTNFLQSQQEEQQAVGEG